MVWKQVKVAASNKTNKQSNTRALTCSGPIGATPEERQEAFLGAPRASQEGPPGSQKGYKTQWVLTNCGLEASQGGTKQQGRQEEQQDGPKRLITIVGPPTFGLGVSLGSPNGL